MAKFTNSGVCHEFVHTDNEAFAENLYTHGDGILYSYGTHWPLGIKLTDNVFAINNSYASVTTSQHASKYAGAIPSVVDEYYNIYLDIDDMLSIVQARRLKNNTIIRDIVINYIDEQLWGVAKLSCKYKDYTKWTHYSDYTGLHIRGLLDYLAEHHEKTSKSVELNHLFFDPTFWSEYNKYSRLHEEQLAAKKTKLKEGREQKVAKRLQAIAEGNYKKYASVKVTMDNLNNLPDCPFKNKCFSAKTFSDVNDIAIMLSLSPESLLGNTQIITEIKEYKNNVSLRTSSDYKLNITLDKFKLLYILSRIYEKKGTDGLLDNAAKLQDVTGFKPHFKYEQIMLGCHTFVLKYLANTIIQTYKQMKMQHD